MSLYKQWEKTAYETTRTQQEYDAFWGDYLSREKAIYEYILGNKQNKLVGKVLDLAKKFDMDHMTFVGFLDGINTSLTVEIDLETVTEDSTVSLEIEWEKLFYNMLDARAQWLYTLPQWDDILTEAERKEIKKTFDATKTVVKEKKIGRNEPCPCGSGKKYKKCCLK